MELGEVEQEYIETNGVFKDFYSAGDFLMAFSVANSMNRVGEECFSALTQSCLQAMRFLNTYAARVDIHRDNVISLLTEFGLQPTIVNEVVDRVIDLSHNYRSLVDGFIQSLSSYSLVDFDWSIRLVICDGNSNKRQLLIVRVVFSLQNEGKPLSTVIELDKQQLKQLLSIFDEINGVMGLVNKNL